MLSIAIPVYNYPIFPLVAQLHREASALNLTFEILVCDDASEKIVDNTSITKLPFTRFLQNKSNQHIAYTRNKLLYEAQYPWVLLVDADTLPVSENFIQTYVQQINSGLFFQGGFTYLEPLDPKNISLRLKYGIEIEQHKHLHSCCNLFFNQRELQLQFDASIKTYGYEDTLFFLQLKDRNIEVHRINNKVYHLNTETSEAYLERSRQACFELAILVQQQKIKSQDIQLSHFYNQINRWYLTPFITCMSSLFGSAIEKKLLSKNPPMVAFKLFKLMAFHTANQAIQKK